MDVSLTGLRRWLSDNRRNKLDKPSAVAFVILLIWFAGNVVSPYLATAGTVDFGNDGVVGGSENDAEIALIDSGFARFFYHAGDANCHQHTDRSFFLNDNQMPFCSRCTAIFFGLGLGVFILIFLSLELNIIWIILGLVPMALDGGIQLLTDYESNNPLRFITGCLAGIVTGIALGYIVSEMGKMAINRRGLKKGSP